MSSYFLNFKKLVFTFSAILLVSTFSCSDDETCQGEVANVPTNFPIEGLWIGSYTIDNFPSLGSQYLSFIIKPESKLILDSNGTGGQYLSIGTWSLSGQTLNCTIVCVYSPEPALLGAKQTFSVTWDKTGKLTDGTWRTVSSNGGTGKFTMSRVN
ncbi:MAG TPA: hypothetical protein PK622_08140 [Saprospiraceae bacterium]|nr:hypothetical protein [Saprospiraceae bacterium]